MSWTYKVAEGRQSLVRGSQRVLDWMCFHIGCTQVLCHCKVQRQSRCLRRGSQRVLESFRGRHKCPVTLRARQPLSLSSSHSPISSNAQMPWDVKTSTLLVSDKGKPLWVIACVNFWNFSENYLLAGEGFPKWCTHLYLIVTHSSCADGLP